MLYYVYARTWAINTSVKNVTFDEDFHITDNFTVKISNKQPFGHDVFPGIDVKFHSNAVAVLYEFFNTIDKKTEEYNGKLNFDTTLQLHDINMRFTDYGFLNMHVIFKLNSYSDFTKSNNDYPIYITRKINAFAEKYLKNKILPYLESKNLLERSSTCDFCVPNHLNGNTDSIDWFDSYLYNQLFFTDDGDEFKTLYARTQEQQLFTFSENTYRTDVVFKDDGHYFYIKSKDIGINIDEAISTITNISDLHLAESTSYSAYTNCYVSILETLLQSKKKRKPFSSKTLRKILIQNNTNLHKLVSKIHSIDYEEEKYLKKCKEDYPLESKYKTYHDAEELLKYAVHDQEEEDQSNISFILQYILLFITGMTLLSISIDSISFLRHDPSIVYDISTDWINARLFKSILAIVIFATLSVIYFIEKKRK